MRRAAWSKRCHPGPAAGRWRLLEDASGQAATEAVVLLAALVLLGGATAPFWAEWLPRVLDALDLYLAGFRWAWSQPFP